MIVALEKLEKLVLPCSPPGAFAAFKEGWAAVLEVETLVVIVVGVCFDTTAVVVTEA